MLLDLDTRLFLAVNGALPRWLGLVLLGVTFLGSTPAIPVWLAAVMLARRQQRWRCVGHVATGLALATLVEQLVKHAVARPRPWRVLGDTHTYGPLETSPSFPSGHTTTAFAIAVAVGLWWPRARWPLLAVAAAVALSRIGIGMHYPGDVLAGAALGTAASLGVARWFRRVSGA
ncbi:MAG TPA: phosphatase PAP2 family protein [Kofleriaceae bacterium]|nr:phosphatase PAP2 family protein [Kofleriaceae bacterium]